MEVSGIGPDDIVEVTDTHDIAREITGWWRFARRNRRSASAADRGREQS